MTYQTSKIKGKRLYTYRVESSLNEEVAHWTRLVTFGDFNTSNNDTVLYTITYDRLCLNVTIDKLNGVFVIPVSLSVLIMVH